MIYRPKEVRYTGRDWEWGWGKSWISLRGENKIGFMSGLEVKGMEKGKSCQEGKGKERCG